MMVRSTSLLLLAASVCLIDSSSAFLPFSPLPLKPTRTAEAKAMAGTGSCRRGHNHQRGLRMGIFDWLTGGDSSSAGEQAPPVAVPPPQQQRQQPQRGVPSSYDAIHQQAIDSVVAGLQAGLRRMEVEFPPIAQVNKLSDGSKSSEALVRRANVGFLAKVVEAMSRSASTVWVLCGDGLTKQEVDKARLPPNARTQLIKDGAPPCSPGDVILVHPPSDSKQWSAASAMASSAPVVVINGYANNGHRDFEMAYYRTSMPPWIFFLPLFSSLFLPVSLGHSFSISLPLSPSHTHTHTHTHMCTYSLSFLGS